MKKIIFYVFLLIPVLGFAQQQDGDEIELACGVQRWAIKVYTDQDTALINFGNIVPSTIAEQKSIPAPPNIGSNPPRLSTETTNYHFECFIIFYKLESDQDIHLGLVSTNFQDTMVAEICDPSCPGIINTSRYPALRTLRDWFVNTYHPTTSFQSLFLRVRLVGVGFFDTVHGQRGMAANGREIHSIISITPVTEVSSSGDIIPEKFSLHQNYPNPFNPVTKIRYDIPERGYVSLKIYDGAGKEVSDLVNEIQVAGKYEINFDANKYASGIYFCKLSSGNFNDTKLMVLIK